MTTDTQLLAELARFLASRLTGELSAFPPAARDWRPVAQSNTVALILRHLRVEAEWHLRCLEDGRPMPTIGALPDQAAIDAVPIDFETNLRTLDDLLDRFCTLLEASSLEYLRTRTSTTYDGTQGSVPLHFVAYHQLVHIAAHLGQIGTLRNLYLKAHGKPGVFPDNPSYPRASSFEP